MTTQETKILLQEAMELIREIYINGIFSVKNDQNMSEINDVYNQLTAIKNRVEDIHF